MHGIGREPLATGNHILITVAHSPGLQIGWIRARRIRLRHRKATANVAIEQGGKPLLALLRGGKFGQDLHISGVRCVTIKHLRRHGATPHNLTQRCILQVGQPSSESTVRQKEIPQALVLSFLLEVVNDSGMMKRIPGGRDFFFNGLFIRIDIGIHECGEFCLKFQHFRCRRKIHVVLPTAQAKAR